MGRTQPLIPVDAGWLFVLAGLAMLFAALLLPPQQRLHGMRQDLQAMRAEERLAIDRLRAYSDFLMALERDDPVLTRRLAAAQLNLVREGDTPLLIADSASAPVTEWIETTLTPQRLEARPYPESDLSRLVTGPWRRWIIGASVACLFAGLIIGGNRRATGRRNPDRLESRTQTNPLPSEHVD